MLEREDDYDDDAPVAEKKLPMAKIQRTDPSQRVDRKAALVVGDIICLQMPTADGQFVTTLQNPLMAQSRLCTLPLDDIIRPFALVAAFKIEVPEAEADSLDEHGQITFGAKIKLRHVGTDQLLMVNPDKVAEATPAALHAFLYSESGVDPPPKNAYGDFALEPKLKTRHEGDVVTSGEQVRLKIGPDGSHSFLNAMSHGPPTQTDFREVNAVPLGNDVRCPLPR
jgi:hypothetical protein